MKFTPFKECGHPVHKYSAAAGHVGKMPTLLDSPHP